MTLAHEWLSIGMFAGALLLLSLGYSVAFSLGGVSILFGIIGIIFQELNPDLAIFGRCSASHTASFAEL